MRRQWQVTAKPRPTKAKPSKRRTKRVTRPPFSDLEVKYVDYTKGTTAIGTTWTGGEYDPSGTNCLNATLPGTGESARDGRRIRISKIQLQGRVHWFNLGDYSDVPDPVVVRVALVLDQQTNATQLNAEDVYNDSVGGAGDDVFGFRNLEYARRFKVLWTELISLIPTAATTDGTNTGSVGGDQYLLNVHVPCDIVTEYNSEDTGYIGDIVDNSIHVIACASAANSAKIEYISRIRFTG